MELRRLGYFATGAIRENRSGKFSIKSVKELKTEDHSIFDSVMTEWYFNSSMA